MAYKDKEKEREFQKRWHILHREERVKKAKASNIVAKARNKEYVVNYLKSHPCVDCGESDPIVLEFDHVRGEKKGDVSAMISQALSIKTIQNEIDKCEVRCANCHRRVTHHRRLSYSRKVSTPL